MGDHVGIRQSDDDGDAQASAAGADEEEEDGWSDSFRVVPEVPPESGDVVVQKEGGAQGENTAPTSTSKRLGGRERLRSSFAS